MIRILWNSKKNSLSTVVTQNIKKVFILFVRIITNSSSAAGRTRRGLSNTSTCPYVPFDIQQSHHQLQDALDVDLIMCTYRHVLVLPSRRLVRPAAVDDFDI